MSAMDLDDDDDWEPDFVEALIKEQERVISDSQPPPRPEPPPPPPPPSSTITFSPPRHLSQRSAALPPRARSSDVARFKKVSTAVGSSSVLPSRASGSFASEKDGEFGCVKVELGHVLRRLSDSEQECSELKKQRDKKDEQLQFVISRNEKKGAERVSDCANMESSIQLQTARFSSPHPSSRGQIGVSTSKSTGVQTDETSEFAQSIKNDGQHISDNLSKKLLAIWGSPNEQELGKNVVSNLLKASQTDLHSLSGCIGMNISSSLRMDTAVDTSSCILPDCQSVSFLFDLD